MNKTLIAVATAALAASMGLGTAAYAHLALKAATPAAKAVVGPSLKEFRFTFSEAVIPAFSTVKLMDRDGKTIPTASPRQDSANKYQLIVSLNRTLLEGRYQLTWYAVASDTHRVLGSYAFTVKK